LGFTDQQVILCAKVEMDFGEAFW